MKSFLAAIFCVVSFSAFANTDTVFVACSEDESTYNVLFTMNQRQVVSYALNEGNWGENIALTSYEQAQKELWIQYAAGGDDTNYGFVLSLSKNMFQNWIIKSWTSGNDSDNYEPVVNDNLVLCHVLLKKVESPKIDKNNIFKKL